MLHHVFIDNQRYLNKFIGNPAAAFKIIPYVGTLALSVLSMRWTSGG
jgi:hypothetical protein